MTRYRKTLVALTFLATTFGCSNADDSQSQSAITINVDSQRAISGTFEHGETRLTFSSVETESNLVEQVFDFGDLVVTKTLDFREGRGTYETNGVAVDAVHIAALTNMVVHHLHQYVPFENEEQTLSQRALLDSASHLASAPVDTVIAPFDYVAERGWRHIGCSCRYRSLYSGSGKKYNKKTGQCRSGCPGRCGVGCGYDNTYRGRYRSGKYTKDCAEHDYGLDSWTRAADDYSFAGYNCRTNPY